LVKPSCAVSGRGCGAVACCGGLEGYAEYGTERVKPKTDVLRSMCYSVCCLQRIRKSTSEAAQLQLRWAALVCWHPHSADRNVLQSSVIHDDYELSHCLRNRRTVANSGPFLSGPRQHGLIAGLRCGRSPSTLYRERKLFQSGKEIPVNQGNSECIVPRCSSTEKVAVAEL
jgi:hypothetical protein